MENEKRFGKKIYLNNFMNNAEKWKYTFRKKPDVRFNRANAYWQFLEDHYGATIYATKQQLKEFFTAFAGIERSFRDVIKEKEFELPIKQKARLQELKSDYINNFKKTLPEEDKQSFNNFLEATK